MVRLAQSKKPPASASFQARLVINFLLTANLDLRKVELLSPELKKRGMEKEKNEEEEEEEESEQKRRRGKREKVFL